MKNSYYFGIICAIWLASYNPGVWNLVFAGLALALQFYYATKGD